LPESAAWDIDRMRPVVPEWDWVVQHLEERDRLPRW
jgi:hypothetical protein